MERDMISRIRDAIRPLDADETLNATNKFKKRIRACIEENGKHFERQI